MRKPRYTLLVDGKEVYTSNHIPILKEEAEYWFTYLNAFFAEIKCYNKSYTARFYDSNWR